METVLLIAAIVAFAPFVIAVSLIGWVFAGKAEAEDHAFTERRRTRRARSSQLTPKIRASRATRRPRQLTGEQRRFDFPVLTLSTYRSS